MIAELTQYKSSAVPQVMFGQFYRNPHAICRLGPEGEFIWILRELGRVKSYVVFEILIKNCYRLYGMKGTRILFCACTVTWQNVCKVHRAVYQILAWILLLANWKFPIETHLLQYFLQVLHVWNKPEMTGRLVELSTKLIVSVSNLAFRIISIQIFIPF